jgi:hypothetical protein
MPEKRPPENPKDRFFAKKGDGKFFDKNGNEILPKASVSPSLDKQTSDEKKTEVLPKDEQG